MLVDMIDAVFDWFWFVVAFFVLAMFVWAMIEHLTR